MDYYLKEVEGKRLHDHLHSPMPTQWVPNPIIVGAGPSGLAVAACLGQQGVPSLILDRAPCTAALWRMKTYDRLRLHLPKHFCELPLLPFPDHLPTYPTKEEFIAYLDDYVNRFGLRPVFNQSVVSASFDHSIQAWRVKATGPKGDQVEYVTKWLIVASGENAEEFVPKFEGMGEFGGKIIHTSSYKSGEAFNGKKVLVVGCGNSGMEVCLDLCNYGARASIVVRGSVHVLPQEMMGRSTFGLSMLLVKWLPIRVVDRFLLLMSHFMFGDTAKCGLVRPKLGPLQLKNLTGKTPVLDVGTLSKIISGDLKVHRGIKRLRCGAVEFVDGKVENFDAIIFATGYKSNVPSWLKVWLKHPFANTESGGPKTTTRGHLTIFLQFTASIAVLITINLLDSKLSNDLSNIEDSILPAIVLTSNCDDGFDETNSETDRVRLIPFGSDLKIVVLAGERSDVGADLTLIYDSVVEISFRSWPRSDKSRLI